MTVAYLGDNTSYSYFAAITKFPSMALKGYPTLAEVIDATENGEAGVAVIPFENSLGGAVTECIDRFVTANVYINSQFFIPIHHSLIGINGAEKGIITDIYSHNQGLLQCSEYIKKNYPNANLHPKPSTSEALRSITDKTSAAIARVPLSGQTVLDSSIEDDHTNTTRFVTISKEQTFDGDQVSVIFGAKHEPGALFNALAVFADNGLNLLKIESRPQKDGTFKYWFYVEFGCPLDKKRLMEVFSKLSDKTGFIKFIGKY